MYTNPTDYFMGLMKDDLAASGLADAWRKASAADVAVQAPPPVAPISCRKVADDPSLHAAGEFYEADEAFQSAHSVLQVRGARFSLCSSWYSRLQVLGFSCMEQWLVLACLWYPASASAERHQALGQAAQLRRVCAQVDPQFQTVELYGPSDPETGAKSAMDSQTPNGGSAEGPAKAARAGGSGHVKRSAGTNMIAVFAFGVTGAWGASKVVVSRVHFCDLGGGD